MLVSMLVVTTVLVACSEDETPTLIPTAESPSVSPTAVLSESENASVAIATEQPPTPTPPPPTPTPEPLAAMVNGKPIRLADFEKDVARYRMAQEELGLLTDDGEDRAAEIVLNALIETELIAQAAERNGIVVSDQMVADRIQELKQSAGGQESFTAWLETNHWTEEEFQSALKKEMVTERMVEWVTASVPFAVEQVRARYIQVDDEALALSILDQLQNGADFAALAQQYSLDRITGEDGGDLGFFAQGSLLVPAVESAAFALQPGELSELIVAPGPDGTGNVFYLVQVIERDPQREVSASYRSVLLQAAFESWLEEQWNLAEVARYVGEDE